jgi:hypothetical protein
MPGRTHVGPRFERPNQVCILVHTQIRHLRRSFSSLFVFLHFFSFLAPPSTSRQLIRTLCREVCFCLLRLWCVPTLQYGSTALLPKLVGRSVQRQGQWLHLRDRWVRLGRGVETRMSPKTSYLRFQDSIFTFRPYQAIMGVRRVALMFCELHPLIEESDEKGKTSSRNSCLKTSYCSSEN